MRLFASAQPVGFDEAMQSDMAIAHCKSIDDNEAALVFFDAADDDDDDSSAMQSCPGSPSNPTMQCPSPTASLVLAQDCYLQMEPESSHGVASHVARRVVLNAPEGFQCSGSETGSSWSSEQVTSSSEQATLSSEPAMSSDGGTSDESSPTEACGSAAAAKNAGSFCIIKKFMRHKKKRWVVSNRAGRSSIGWMRRLGMASCVSDTVGDEASTSMSGSNNGGTRGSSFERIKVQSYRKQMKELSAVYRGQVLNAHEGAILAMKFSPCGEYLASGGEDGVVRIWRVSESPLPCEVPKDDPSHVYFKLEDDMRISPVCADPLYSKCKSRSFLKSSGSAYVVMPSKVPRISEEPLHEFHGHLGDILDLSWSSDKHLLSSSTDKTVRLWRVGCNSCVEVFRHSNYVTCVQFNPADEKLFISGSIDGKLRIWSVPRCRVMDWVDTREIITAICCRSDGKGAVVGTIVGNCRFYDWTDDHLQLETQISLGGKKKSPLKRVTSLQFSPTNPKELMVTYGDSKIVILDGASIIHRYSGPRGGSCQSSASFTTDGNHIVSTSENSSVYFWNHEEPSGSKKGTGRSCERFFSSNTSVAIPWNGLPSRCSDCQECIVELKRKARESANSRLAEHRLKEGALCQFFEIDERRPEVCGKAAATWPEEMLPTLVSDSSALDESGYKFFGTSFQGSNHVWGQVIVTAGWDGRIQLFQNFGLPEHRH